MSMTRRSLLRNASVLSAAHALGLQRLLKGQAPSPPFASGIRLFFAGAWIFGKDPTNSKNMLAVSFNPSEDRKLGAAMNHKFPFGLWDTAYDHQCAGKWAADQPELGPTPGVNGVFKPHTVSMDGVTPGKATDADSLFLEANNNSGFTYLLNPAGHFKVKLAAKLQRAISIPMPTRIIPAAYRTQTNILGGAKRLHPRTGSAKGIATSHIFVYDGATQLYFQQGDGARKLVVAGSDKSTSNFHFHVIPENNPNDDHAPMMFSHYLHQISHPLFTTVNGMSLPGRTGDEPIDPGPLVPEGTTPAELEIKDVRVCKDLRNVFINTLASCGSGGIGIGGDGFGG